MNVGQTLGFARVVALAVLMASAGVVRGDVVVTFEVRDAADNPVSLPVDVGTQVTVDILLSADEEETLPIENVRGLRFDFSETDLVLSLADFAWVLPHPVSPLLSSPYGLQSTVLPRPDAITLQSFPGFLVSLDTTPVLVATIMVTVDGTGALDVRGATNAGPDEGALVTAGFGLGSDIVLEFTPASGNLSGGTLELTVATEPDGGTTGGGVDPAGDSGADTPADDPGTIDPGTDADPPSTDPDGDDDVLTDPSGTDDDTAATDGEPVEPPDDGSTVDPSGGGDPATAGNDEPSGDDGTDSGGDATPTDGEPNIAADDDTPLVMPRVCGPGMLGTFGFLAATMVGMGLTRRVARMRGPKNRR